MSISRDEIRDIILNVHMTSKDQSEYYGVNASTIRKVKLGRTELSRSIISSLDTYDRDFYSWLRMRDRHTAKKSINHEDKNLVIIEWHNFERKNPRPT